MDSTNYAGENWHAFPVTLAPRMSDSRGTAHDLDTSPDELAAELTSAIYPIVLGSRPRDSWVAVELDLWKALSETVKRWARLQAAAVSADDRKAWQEGLLVDLTQSAYQVALRNGIKGSLLDLKLCLYRAVRLVTSRRSGVAAIV